MAKTAADFQVGQRVQATVYGEQRTGTVTRLGRSTVVYVRWDGRSPFDEQWYHAESLETVV